MTDRLDCPDCGGSGEVRIGSLTLQCEFCLGAGYVGDDNEPAEGHAPGPVPPVWDQIGAEALPGCRMCLGTGRVVNLGGNGRGGLPTTLIEAPCPACQLQDG